MGKVCAINEADSDIVALEVLEGEVKNLAPPLTMIQEYSSGQGVIRYDVEGGIAFGVSLINITEVAVQSLEMSAGTKFPLHSHRSKTDGTPVVELGVVFKGEVEVYNSTTGETQTLKKKQYTVLKENESHRGYAKVDSGIIFVSVPAAEGYPSNGRQSF